MNELLKTAMHEYGVSETNEKTNNPIILQYFKEAGHSWIETEETAWCSAFMISMAKRACLTHSDKLTARSWLNFGTEVEIPNLGDVVIFWRENRLGWKGHVGIYINQIGNNINVLGGNQNNSVCIKPYIKSRLLGYRRLTSTS
jgi:uncharacterized protein (TIGR02594 family)